MERTSDCKASRFLTLNDEALLCQCEMTHYRASGPGGQKRNKTSSAVRLRHRPTGLTASAADDRYQRVNRARAIRRLRRAIAFHVRAEPELPEYEPSGLLSAHITPEGAIRVSPQNPHYYVVICEVLDVLAACGTRVREAAKRIGVSMTQLVQLFRRDPKLWQQVNHMRMRAGLKSLR